MRRYWLYRRPARRPAGRYRLIMLLHGCSSQDAAGFAASTGGHPAPVKRVALLLPSRPGKQTPRCWNWFRRRRPGQPGNRHPQVDSRPRVPATQPVRAGQMFAIEFPPGRDVAHLALRCPRASCSRQPLGGSPTTPAPWSTGRRGRRRLPGRRRLAASSPRTPAAAAGSVRRRRPGGRHPVGMRASDCGSPSPPGMARSAHPPPSWPRQRISGIRRVTDWKPRRQAACAAAADPAWAMPGAAASPARRSPRPRGPDALRLAWQCFSTWSHRIPMGSVGRHPPALRPGDPFTASTACCVKFRHGKRMAKAPFSTGVASANRDAANPLHASTGGRSCKASGPAIKRIGGGAGKVGDRPYTGLNGGSDKQSTTAAFAASRSGTLGGDQHRNEPFIGRESSRPSGTDAKAQQVRRSRNTSTIVADGLQRAGRDPAPSAASYSPAHSHRSPVAAIAETAPRAVAGTARQAIDDAGWRPSAFDPDEPRQNKMRETGGPAFDVGRPVRRPSSSPR